MPASIIFTILNLIIFSGIMIWFSPLVYGIFLAISLLNIGWMSLFLRYRREVDYPMMSKMGENRNNIYEIVSGIEEIKSSRAQNARLAVWHKVQEHINSLSLRSSCLNIYQSGGNQLLDRVRDALITGLCAMLVVDGEMTIGIMMTVSYISGHLKQPINNIKSSINDIQDSMMSYQRLDAIMSERENATGNNHKIDSIYGWGLREACFKYPGESSPFILDDCSIDIQIGKSLAIVGESGCGKSTLLKVLTGSFLPSGGDLIVNDKTFDGIDEESFSSHLGMVMQNGTIYSASIAENIGFSEMEPDMEKVRDAARLACIDGFIESLPMGYDTRIGTTGIQLSRGQSQRIFIARALYRNPPILILDEATSSLDANTEAKIMDNIFTFCKGRTLIVAAHRLSTVRNADKIIVIKNGTIAEEGNHRQLIDANGIYSSLIRNQMMED